MTIFPVPDKLRRKPRKIYESAVDIKLGLLAEETHKIYFSPRYYTNYEQLPRERENMVVKGHIIFPARKLLKASKKNFMEELHTLPVFFPCVQVDAHVLVMIPFF